MPRLRRHLRHAPDHLVAPSRGLFLAVVIVALALHATEYTPMMGARQSPAADKI
jgi:hypothetical protein